jgi:hypothetical protein
VRLPIRSLEFRHLSSTDRVLQPVASVSFARRPMSLTISQEIPASIKVDLKQSASGVVVKKLCVANVSN